MHACHDWSTHEVQLDVPSVWSLYLPAWQKLHDVAPVAGRPHRQHGERHSLSSVHMVELFLLLCADWEWGVVGEIPTK